MYANALLAAIPVTLFAGACAYIWKDDSITERKWNAEYERGYDWAAGKLVRRDMTVSQVKAEVPKNPNAYYCGVRDAAHKLRNSNLVRR